MEIVVTIDVKVRENGMMTRLRALPGSLDDEKMLDLVLRPLNVSHKMTKLVHDRLRLVLGLSPPERAPLLLRLCTSCL